MKRAISFLLILSLLAACNNKDHTNTGGVSADNTPPTLDYAVMKLLPHDTTAFTEGLLFHDGQLYESTGTDTNMPESRRSLFGTVDTTTGKIHPKVEIDRRKYFGEGIAFIDGKVYQLTYTTKVGFVYDATTFKKLGEFTIPTHEGWGMTTNGTDLIMSDGTSNITYLDPHTFRTVKTLTVSDNNGPVSNVNELELIHGYLYANQWQTNYILKIDTTTGKVVGRLDLDSLAAEARNKFSGSDVLNGIAYNPASGLLYVTGKLWPNIYEIKTTL
ncbi:MAG TPA: glutaminyl-peptide cyclotransferase [Puia sp.]|jgi:glutamine cyclotransferase|nr:glutaminyl-peptide cyclotransferase [Puia sp.]